MLLTISQLRTFERIVRLGSFRAAASHLGLTQPSASQRIKELEYALNTKLFVRKGPHVSLTAEGHALLEYADRMLETAGEIVERFRSNDPLKGLLRLGLTESFALICLVDLLEQLGKLHPQLRISVHVGDTPSLSRLLNECKLDVAVVSEPEIQPHVRTIPIGTNELGWVAGSGFALSQDVLSPKDLSEQPLVITPSPARLHETATNWFAEANLPSIRVSTCNNLTITKLMIVNGLAIGLVPTRTMLEEIKAGQARLLNVLPPIDGHRVSICYQASEFGPSLQAVFDLIRDLVREHSLFG